MSISANAGSNCAGVNSDFKDQGYVTNIDVAQNASNDDLLRTLDLIMELRLTQF